MDDMKLAKGIVLGVLIALTFGWTYTYDTDWPLGSDAPSVLDDSDRLIKDAVQERMNVDHYWPLTGSEVSDAATGQHRQIEFYGPIVTPTNAANKSWLYSKDVTDKAELHWLDEDDNEIQFTSAGAFNAALLTSLTITTPTLTSPTLTSPVINTGVSGTGVLDEDDMASDSATKLSTQQSIKAYIDAEIAEAVAAAVPDDDAFGTWSSLADDTVYTATADGFVCAYAGTSMDPGDYLEGQTPTGTRRAKDSVSDDEDISIMFPVRKGDTWKVVTGGCNATVYRLKIGR